MTTTLATNGRNAGIDGIAALADGGVLELLSSGDVILATLTLFSTAFDAGSAGVATARGGDDTNPISVGNPLVMTGLAAASGGVAIAKHRFKTSGAAIFITTDGAATSGDSAAALILDSLTIDEAQTVNITGLTLTQPA